MLILKISDKINFFKYIIWFQYSLYMLEHKITYKVKGKPFEKKGRKATDLKN